MVPDHQWSFDVDGLGNGTLHAATAGKQCEKGERDKERERESARGGRRRRSDDGIKLVHADNHPESCPILATRRRTLGSSGHGS